MLLRVELSLLKKVSYDHIPKLEDKYGERQEGLFGGSGGGAAEDNRGGGAKDEGKIPGGRGGDAGAKPVEAFGEKIGETIQVFVVAKNGILIKSPRTAYADIKQGSLFDEGIPDSELRPDNIPTGAEVLQGREVSNDRGISRTTYSPKRGTIPEVRSRPIGTWRSSRSAIKTPEDAAVIARDNIGSDAQETLVSIVTDKSGKILAIK